MKFFLQKRRKVISETETAMISGRNHFEVSLIKLELIYSRFFDSFSKEGAELFYKDKTEGKLCFKKYRSDINDHVLDMLDENCVLLQNQIDEIFSTILIEVYEKSHCPNNEDKYRNKSIDYCNKILLIWRDNLCHIIEQVFDDVEKECRTKKGSVFFKLEGIEEQCICKKCKIMLPVEQLFFLADHVICEKCHTINKIDMYVGTRILNHLNLPLIKMKSTQFYDDYLVEKERAAFLVRLLEELTWKRERSAIFGEESSAVTKEILRKLNERKATGNVLYEKYVKSFLSEIESFFSEFKERRQEYYRKFFTVYLYKESVNLINYPEADKSIN